MPSAQNLSDQPSAQPAFGIAIVGTGFGQKVHIPGFQAHASTHLAAIYHRDLAKAQALAKTHNIPHACSTLEQVVALPEVQGVSISTPPFTHDEMAKTVLQAGKHLLLEKPAALAATEAKDLYKLAAEKGVIAAMDFEFRCVPEWLRLEQLLSEDYVGRKRLVKVDWLVSSRANPDRPWNWYARKEQGGGALGALGSHTFDYIAWLFGPVKRLSAALSTAIPWRTDPVDGELKLVDADDTCTLQLELADGTPCQVCISTATYQGRGHWVEVYGDRGTLVLGSDNQKDYIHGFRLWASQGGQPLEPVAVPEPWAFPKTYNDGRIAPFIRVVERWVEAIQTGTDCVPSLKEGVYSQLLMDVAYESDVTGTWVDVLELERFLNGT